MADWQKIETAKRGRLILYFPQTRNDGHPGNDKPPVITIDQYPVGSPRKPSHWMPLPDQPREDA